MLFKSERRERQRNKDKYGLKMDSRSVFTIKEQWKRRAEEVERRKLRKEIRSDKEEEESDEDWEGW